MSLKLIFCVFCLALACHAFPNSNLEIVKSYNNPNEARAGSPTFESKLIEYIQTKFADECSVQNILQYFFYINLYDFVDYLMHTMENSDFTAMMDDAKARYSAGEGQGTEEPLPRLLFEITAVVTIIAAVVAIAFTIYDHWPTTTTTTTTTKTPSVINVIITGDHNSVIIKTTPPPSETSSGKKRKT